MQYFRMVVVMHGPNDLFVKTCQLCRNHDLFVTHMCQMIFVCSRRALAYGGISSSHPLRLSKQRFASPYLCALEHLEGKEPGGIIVERKSFPEVGVLVLADVRLHSASHLS